MNFSWADTGRLELPELDRHYQRLADHLQAESEALKEAQTGGKHVVKQKGRTTRGTGGGWR